MKQYVAFPISQDELVLLPINVNNSTYLRGCFVNYRDIHMRPLSRCPTHSQPLLLLSSADIELDYLGLDPALLLSI